MHVKEAALKLKGKPLKNRKGYTSVFQLKVFILSFSALTGHLAPLLKLKIEPFSLEMY